MPTATVEIGKWHEGICEVDHGLNARSKILSYDPKAPTQIKNGLTLFIIFQS
jgi:hypothetical protein